jgi:hypothetical protein
VSKGNIWKVKEKEKQKNETMVGNLSAECRSMLHEPTTDLAARVERNRIWMDTFGGNRAMSAS